MRLPPWAPSLRPTQAEAIGRAVTDLRNGINIVMIEAPTGSGKTLIAEMVRQELHARALYLCSTLALQDQFARDFPDAAILRGRSNYATADAPLRYPSLSALDCSKQTVTFRKCRVPCESCKPYDCDCRGSQCMQEEAKVNHCRWCHPVISCPYETAKFEAVQSDLVCTNLAYFLTEANYVGSLTHNRKLIIVDEADLLEEQLLSFVTMTVTDRQQTDYGIFVPERKTVKESWVEWADTTYRHLTQLCRNYMTAPNESDVKLLRREREVNRLASDLEILQDPEHGLVTDNWIYTGYDRGIIEFKPIRVDALAQSFLWRHCTQWVLMSATLISFGAMAESLGLS